MIVDASACVGTTLEVEHTAKELVDVAVPGLTDIATGDILDDVFAFRPTALCREPGPEMFRTHAVAAAYPTPANTALAAGDLTAYGADRLITRCVHTRQPIVVTHADGDDLQRIARDPAAAAAFAQAGVHSCLAVPLIARTEVLGALGLLRTGAPPALRRGRRPAGRGDRRPGRHRH
nr:GAF domain-containing protein [Streptomyces rimosus]